jgi:hypothetical protein
LGSARYQLRFHRIARMSDSPMGFQGFPGSGKLAELFVNHTFSFIAVDVEWSFANKFKNTILSKRPRTHAKE